MNLREEDNTDEIDDQLKDAPTITSTVTTTVANVSTAANEKIFVLVNMKSSSSSSQTLGFLPHDNNEIALPTPVKASLTTLTFAFRTRSNVSTLLQFDPISLNIDVDGYLALVHRDKQAQRLLINDEQRPINDGNLYSVYLQRTETTLNAWIMKNKKVAPKKISMEVTASALTGENLLFGPRSQFLGCFENITYNEQVLSLKHLPNHRQQCPSSSIVLKSREILSTSQIYIDQMISFKEYDRPLIVRLDAPESFRTFSFLLHTQESTSMICSLADRTYEHFLTLSIQNKYLLFTYDDVNQQRTRIYLNNSTPINDGREHRIQLQFVNAEEFAVEIDGQSVSSKVIRSFPVHAIYMGQLDGFIKEKFADFEGDYFVGCLKDVMFNERSVMKLEHLHHLDRLTNVCQLSKRGRKLSSSMHYSSRWATDSVTDLLKESRWTSLKETSISINVNQWRLDFSFLFFI